MHVRKSQTWRNHPIVSLVRVRVHVAYSQVGDLQCVRVLLPTSAMYSACVTNSRVRVVRIKCVSPSRVVEYRAPP